MVPINISLRDTLISVRILDKINKFEGGGFAILEGMELKLEDWDHGQIKAKLGLPKPTANCVSERQASG